MVLISEIAIGQRTLALFNVHLESRGSDELRVAQLSEACEEIAPYSSPRRVILAGDFNFDVSQSRAAALVSHMQLENPFEGIGERRTTPNSRAIDCILTGTALSAVHPEIHSSVNASDHYPLSLDISFL
jgi:endonuclease/exonuclease/phosphatase family metal-dependent hydrolase